MTRIYKYEMLDMIYRAGKAVYEYGADPKQYMSKCKDMGISWRSFIGWYVPAFKYMRNGITLKGNIPQDVRKYMLERIYTDYGRDGLRLAMKSYIGTIEYYESMGIKKRGDRLIAQHFQNILKND